MPDQSKELLRELHLLTREGNLNADALRKLKQVNHLVGLLGPALDDLSERFESPVLALAGDRLILIDMDGKPTLLVRLTRVYSTLFGQVTATDTAVDGSPVREHGPEPVP